MIPKLKMTEHLFAFAARRTHRERHRASVRGLVKMLYQLEFEALHEYDAGADGITLPVELSGGGHRIRTPAKLDTGASFCIFQREHGEELGLDIERGVAQRVGTATGSFLTYAHELTISALGLEFAATIYFASIYGFTRNVVGRAAGPTARVGSLPTLHHFIGERKYPAWHTRVGDKSCLIPMHIFMELRRT